MKRQFGRAIVCASMLFISACGAGGFEAEGEGFEAPRGAGSGGSTAGSTAPQFGQSVSGARGGALRQLEIIETSHPYADGFARRWEVYGSRDARELVVRFERFELEDGYDFITITDGAGGQRSQHTGTETGTELVVSGNRITASVTTDESIHGWGMRLVVFERLPCICDEEYAPVCGEDEETYSNACFAGCAGVEVASEGECGSPEVLHFESRHRSIVIPDASLFGISSTIEIPAQATTRRVRVSVEIRHPYRGDLRVSVIAPNGAESILHDRTGGTQDDLSIREVPVGVARAGERGIWRLVVRDLDARDVGTLDKWWIDLE